MLFRSGGSGNDLLIAATNDGSALVMTGGAGADTFKLAALAADLQAKLRASTRIADLTVAEDATTPGQLNFTSAAIGSGGHLGGELLKNMTGMAATHISYRGTGPALIAVMANEVQFMIAGLLPAMAQVKVNRLRAIGVTSAKRSSFIPELPTVAEQGFPGFEVVGWYGALAPRGTSPAIINRLYSDIVKILAQPDIKERIAGEGAEVVGSTPAEFAAFLKTDIARWAPLIKQSGAKAD